ncbi:nuclear polyadenylated RNA-binding protein 3 [Malania oleifera]|uniref:nuclear polyadenylated RNA-binding protein 3 n=1 Tax=Malania oleifera TaxID=397392 RepID=UPI0025AE3F25|nr:nuclear polyadenylated RNA-binding protein 3 [Malania oleifera]
MPISGSDLLQDQNAGGSDSDSNTDESPEFYEPISVIDVDDDDDDEDSDRVNSDEDHQHLASNFHTFPNGYARGAENRISALDLNDGEEEDEEEERMREASDSAIRRAFREDESRRNAPLTPENAERVREAMRGVVFPVELCPEWARQVPEDRWVDRLRRLRQPPHSAT